MPLPFINNRNFIVCPLYILITVILLIYSIYSLSNQFEIFRVKNFENQNIVVEQHEPAVTVESKDVDGVKIIFEGEVTEME